MEIDLLVKRVAREKELFGCGQRLWTADIIRNPAGQISPLLERFEPGFTEKVAQLLEKEDPEDIYHAVVSSSFDADRLDYLQRDRMMTGIGAGAIDFDWLIENVRVADIDLNAPDEGDGEAPKAPTFCLEKMVVPRHLAPDHFHERPRGMEHANRVGEARMHSARKHELGDAELTDSTQALEFRGVNEVPGERIDA